MATLCVVLASATAQAKPWKRLLAQAKKTAPPVASCSLFEILASSEKKGIDSKLKKWEAKLTKPPFSGWDTFKLVGEPTVKAEKDKPVTVNLWTKGKLTLLLKEKVVAQGGKARLRMGFEADRKDGTRFLSTVITFGTGEFHAPLAGIEVEKGIHYILALSCTVM
jgi:hypothetical protein